jgi:16S rRNA G966 N2-methylase RsmD
MILRVLNKKNALRDMSDDLFEKSVSHMANELSQVSYITRYDETTLLKDWNSLVNWTPTGQETASTTRVGMKLCEHYFPNFYNIKNSKGESFQSKWNPTVLEKVLRWNRKSHSTPYLSEIKRGIYFCSGLTKNTMFRPHLAKSIAIHYNAMIVLDPCAGWGGRMLGAVASGAEYIGYEPNLETFNNLVELATFLNITDRVQLYNTPAENMDTHQVDVVLTSPPYFNLEIYSDGPNQSENYYSSYEEWRDKWLAPIVMKSTNNSKVSCWNTHNVGKMKMIEDIENIHTSLGFKYDTSFSLNSSKRQANQNMSRNLKNKDLTNCYVR